MHTRISISAAITGVLLCTTASGAVELTFASGLATSHSVAAFGGAKLMACAEERSAGDITFSYFPTGQLVSTSNAVEGLEQGLADIAFVAPVGQSAKLPLTGLALIPGMGGSAVEMAAAFREVVDGDNPISNEIRNLGLRPLTVISSPPYQVLSARGPIQSIDDFDGLKLRAAGSSMLLAAQSLGAVPVEVVGGDSYVALQRGTIDATITPGTSAKSYSLQELSKSMSTNANFGTPVYFYAISEEAWNGLTAEQQTVLEDCGSEVEGSANAALDQEEREVIEEFAQVGVEPYELSPELISQIDKKLSDVAQTYIGRLESAGVSEARDAYDTLRAALD